MFDIMNSYKKSLFIRDGPISMGFTKIFINKYKILHIERNL